MLSNIVIFYGIHSIHCSLSKLTPLNLSPTKSINKIILISPIAFIVHVCVNFHRNLCSKPFIHGFAVNPSIITNLICSRRYLFRFTITASLQYSDSAVKYFTSNKMKCHKVAGVIFGPIFSLLPRMRPHGRDNKTKPKPFAEF